MASGSGRGGGRKTIKGGSAAKKRAADRKRSVKRGPRTKAGKSY
jgi:hypothetical protein